MTRVESAGQGDNYQYQLLELFSSAKYAVRILKLKAYQCATWGGICSTRIPHVCGSAAMHCVATLTQTGINEVTLMKITAFLILAKWDWSKTWEYTTSTIKRKRTAWPPSVSAKASTFSGTHASNCVTFTHLLWTPRLADQSLCSKLQHRSGLCLSRCRSVL